MDCWSDYDDYANQELDERPGITEDAFFPALIVVASMIIGGLIALGAVIWKVVEG